MAENINESQRSQGIHDPNDSTDFMGIQHEAVPKVGVFTDSKRNSMPPETAEFASPPNARIPSFKVGPSPDSTLKTTSTKMEVESRVPGLIRAATEEPRIVN